MRVAVLQCTSVPSIEESLANLKPLIEEAGQAGCDLMLLPENFAFLGESTAIRAEGGRIFEQALEFVTEQAAQQDCWIVGGGVPVPAANPYFTNRALVASPEGLIDTYDKIHLFDTDLPDRSYRESDVMVAGDRVVSVAMDPEWTLGLSICYDLRFPELYRKLSEQGANLLLVPAAFTRPTGEDHWECLLRARAIENTCYVLAAAQCGTHYQGRETYGHAMIIDPWGKILGELGDEPGLLVHDLELSSLKESRSRIPCLDHRTLF